MAVPAVPSGASAHSEGSYKITVPGSDRVRKKLCLNGTALNECRTITVPAVQPVELTVSWTGNAGAEAPKFTPEKCRGGLSVKVSGLTPATNLTLTAAGTRISVKVPERSAHQTASLCDA